MHMILRPGKLLAFAVALTGILALAPEGAAAPQPMKVEVRGWLGRVSYSHAGGPFQPLKKDTVLEVGDGIQTEAGSAVDLFLSDVAGTVRLTERSTLILEQAVIRDPATGASFEVKLALKSGELLGHVMPHGGGSRFQVAVPLGIGAVVEGQFRIDARGYMVLLDGQALFVHAPSEGEPIAHPLSAPPAVYFSPKNGVHPAPEELIREVTGQTRSKLPKR
jgi:hypothetical protein